VGYQGAHRVAWSWSAVFGLAVIGIEAVGIGRGWGVMVQMAFAGVSASLLSIGWWERQRSKDEPVMNELLLLAEELRVRLLVDDPRPRRETD
jgi:hypothetical protein